MCIKWYSTCQVGRAVVLLQVRVGGGIPLVHVDAVGDAVQHVLPRLQDLVQAPAALRRRDLPRVPLARQCCV